MEESRRDGRLELHALMGYRMVETKQIGMQAEPPTRVVTVAILDVAANGIPHIGAVDANLVLAPGLQTKLHQTVANAPPQHMKMSDRILASIVGRTRISDVGAVVLQPVGDGSLVVCHLPTEYGHIAAVVDDMMPVVFQGQFGLLVLGINHEATGVAIQAVDDVGRTTLAALAEISIEHLLHVERLVASLHRQNPDVLLYHDNVLVLIDQPQIAAVEGTSLFRLAHRDGVARLQGPVELCPHLAVDPDAPPLQCGLDAAAALALQVFQQPLQQRPRGLHFVLVVIVALLITHLLHGGKVTKKLRDSPPSYPFLSLFDPFWLMPNDQATNEIGRSQ